jgi:adenosyl cobinamide kinase/adenosyl cobinamide phosphate guanylyltransferase
VAEPLVLVLGGTRSGKSRFALRRIAELAGPDARVWFLATAWPGDPELDDRIARHRRERPSTWPTIDVGSDLAAAIGTADGDEPILLDGLTLWLSGILGDDTTSDAIDPLLDGPVAAALRAMDVHHAPLVVVSDDVGGGIIPLHPGARAFRDLAGIVHQRIAAIADEVVLTVAGLPLELKGGSR